MILRRVLELKFKKKLWEDPEQDGSATYWKYVRRQEKDSSYVKWKTSESGDSLFINPPKTEMLLETDNCEYWLLKCRQRKMRETNVGHICNLGILRRTMGSFMLMLLPPWELHLDVMTKS